MGTYLDEILDFHRERSQDDVRSLDALVEKTTEFDLLVQRTINGIAVGKKIRRSIQLLERTPNSPQKVSGWRNIIRDTYNNGKNILFRKKL